MTYLPQSHSPDGFEFEPRRPKFDIEAALETDWHGGNAFVTAWFNALSSLFPLGEKFFIDSVAYFEDQVTDPRLKREIAAFRAQESVHRIQHQRYNELLCRLRHYDLDELEGNVRRRMAWAYSNLSPRRRLAGTVANEHMTAIMADDMLRNGDVFEGVEPDLAALWQWHGIEETEHKSVAFDVFTAVGGTTSERRRALLLNTFFFHKDTMRNACIMLRRDGKLWKAGEWYRGLKFLFVSPGPLRRIMRQWLAFFRRDFHPWQDDNRYLIDQWRERSL